MIRARAGALVFAAISSLLLTGCAAVRDNSFPACRPVAPTVLMAQAVPGARLVPCIRSLPIGWHVHGLDVRSGTAQFWLDSDLVGARALDVVFSGRCTVGHARRAPSDEPGARRLIQVQRRRPAFVGQWRYLFPGGCVTYRFAFATTDRRGATEQIQRGLSFISRDSLAAAVRRQTGESLDPLRSSP